MSNVKTRIIGVTRKPSKCPVCGSDMIDIIYGTGDMTKWIFCWNTEKMPLWVEITSPVGLPYRVVPADANVSER